MGDLLDLTDIANVEGKRETYSSNNILIFLLIQ